MKILIVCSGNHPTGINPFIREQTDSLKRIGVDPELFLIKGKAALGYLKNLAKLRKIVKSGHYDLVHAHYGLSGMLAACQTVPVTGRRSVCCIYR